MSLLIQTNDLYKSYGKTEALKGIDLKLNSGEILGLLGPNGAGKTTMIHIFLGLLTPSKGHVEVLGMSPLKKRHKIAHKINFSSAYIQLPSNLKVIENLKLFAGLYNVKKAKDKIQSLMEQFKIDHLSTRLTGALSSGEKTRLNLCKCLLNDPCMLLMDEPTASLDPEMADTVRKIIKKIQKENNLGMLYTSHNMKEIEEVCDRIMFLHHGKIIAEGSHDDMLKKFESRDLDEVFIKIVRGKN